jgi:hypothetical protein
MRRAGAIIAFTVALMEPTIPILRGGTWRPTAILTRFVKLTAQVDC